MRKDLFKDSFLYGVSDLISKGIAALLFPLFTQFLHVKDFGILSLITIISTLGTFLVECGINNAIQLLYFDTKYNGKRAELISSGFFLQLSGGVIVIVILSAVTFLLQSFFKSHYQIEIQWILLAIFVILPSLLIKYILNVLRLHYKPVLFGVISFITNLLWMFLALYFFKYTKLGISGYFLANAILLVLTLPIAIFSIRSEFKLVINKSFAKEIFLLGSPFILSNIAYWVFGSMDRWILAEFSNIKEVGLYSVAFKFSAIITMIHAAFSQAWSPLLLKHLYADVEQSIKSIKEISKFYLSSLALACSILILFLPEVFNILTPKEYYPAIYSSALIATGLFFNSISQFTVIGLSFKKRTREINVSSWAAIIFNAIVTTVLSISFGSIGSSVALLVTYIFWTNLYNYFSSKVFQYKFRFSDIYFALLLLFFSNSFLFLSSTLSHVQQIYLIGFKILFIAIAFTFYYQQFQNYFRQFQLKLFFQKSP